MSLLHQIRKLWRRLISPRSVDLIVDDDGFALRKADLIIERYRWDQVNQVTAFKRDHGMYDEICLQFDFSRREEPLVVSEDFGGFDRFLAECETRLPGMLVDWWINFAFPAFEENATVTFARPGPV